MSIPNYEKTRKRIDNLIEEVQNQIIARENELGLLKQKLEKLKKINPADFFYSADCDVGIHYQCGTKECFCPCHKKRLFERVKTK